MPDPYAEVQDPQTPAARLAELAGAHPELGPWIAAHPNAYPELRQWIATYATPAANAAARPAAATTAAPRSRPAHSSRRGLLLGLGIGLAVALVVGGGGAWWFLTSRLGGASSPEAAFTKLISGVESMDPLTLYGSFAPSEVGLLQEPLQKISSSGAEDGVDVQELLSTLKSAVHITTDDLAFSTEELADGVARVTWTDGSITVDGDEERIATALVDSYAPLMRDQYAEDGYSDDEIDDILSDAQDSLAEQIDLPQTVTAQDASDDAGGIMVALVMVDEGNGWYVSPLLSYADTSYRAAAEYDSSLGRLGDEIVTPAVFATPEDAADGLLEAAMSGDVEEVAAALPLAERRVVSIYGPALWSNAGQSLEDVTLDSSEFAAEVDGDIARLTIERLDFSTTTYDSDVSDDLTDTLSISGTCAEWTNQYASYLGYSWSSRSRYEVETTSGSGCAEDVPLLANLGVADAAVIAVKENGGWLVSPTRTVADAASIAVDHFIDYEQNGRLDELFE